MSHERRGNNTVERSCHSKQAYRSWAKATYDARQINRQDRSEPPVEVYMCRTCGAIHIGTQLYRSERRAA